MKTKKIAGCYHRCKTKTKSTAEDIEVGPLDHSHTIGQLIRDIKVLDDMQFTERYKQYHNESFQHLNG